MHILRGKIAWSLGMLDNLLELFFVFRQTKISDIHAGKPSTWKNKVLAI